MTEHEVYASMSREQLLQEIRLVLRMLGSDQSLPALVHELQVHRVEVHAQHAQLVESQQALEESRDRYADLYDFAPIGFVTLDAGGTIREANLAAAALLGVTRDRLIGLPLLGHVVAGDRALYLEHLGRCRKASGGTTTAVIVHLGTSAAESVLVSLVCRATRGRDDQLLLQTGIFDLSATERAESARRESELERLRLLREEETLRAESAAKDRFFAVLSHELRTPLTPILLTLAALESRAEIPPELREPLSMVRRNVELEARLIDDLLDTTRISHGKLHLQIGTVNTHALVRSVVETAASELEAARIELELDLGASRYHVAGDAVRLRQVLWNVLSNAIRHTPPGGRIAFTSSNPTPDRLRLVVRDDGAGISPELLKRIFEPFEQAHDRSRSGLGLGLTIAKGIVDAHAGSIAAHSAGAGRGTGIEIELAAILEPVAEDGVAPGAPAATTGLRVLLVEDHHDSALALQEILEMQGHAVTLAGSLAEASREKGHPFDLLISDIGLPDGSGLDVLRLLAARPPQRSIALSGYGSVLDVERSRAAGFDLHLTKPIDLDALLTAIDSLSALR